MNCDVKWAKIKKKRPQFADRFFKKVTNVLLHKGSEVRKTWWPDAVLVVDWSNLKSNLVNGKINFEMISSAFSGNVFHYEKLWNNFLVVFLSVKNFGMKKLPNFDGICN